MTARIASRATSAGLVVLAIACAFGPGARAADLAPFHTITTEAKGPTIVLTGRDLTLEQLVRVARQGAMVSLGADALRRQGDAYGLVLEASAEGIPVYGFNRGSGAGREISLFKGDPLAPENTAAMARRLQSSIEDGPRQGIGPEVADEEIVRAFMLVRVNTMTFEGVSPAMSRLLVEMLNRRISPVIQSRGSLGEGDLPQAANLLGAMGGAGEVYYRGVRMPATKAFQAAGLKPLQPGDLVYTPYLGSNAYGAGQAALLTADARQALDWADLVYAMDLDAMNSSVTPLATPVQTLRPFRYANLDAARVLDMLRGGYLLDNDPTRIIQDPESLRASFSRQGAAWKAWATLRDTVLLQINSSDHNPAALVDASPQDSWELSSPQMMKYYVKGGPLSHGQHGYVFSNANWDPYPLANEVEAFSNALANMDVAVVQRIYRLGSPFFTVVAPKDVLSPQELASAAPMGMGYDPTALWQEIQSLARPLTPEGNPISQNVEELQAQTSLKIGHARQAVDDTLRLLGEDLLTATYWLDVRHKQDPGRAFGAAPTSAWTAFRKVSSWQAPAAGRPAAPDSDLGYAFLKSNTAAAFYPPAAQAIDAGLEP